ncbi:MAG: class I SAM-dependent methyltransferase [archaeon]|jgi:hypothetical protein
MVLCKICSTKTDLVFKQKIRGKYTGEYYHCPNCKFTFVNNPTWLKEAYKEPINAEDTGLIQRNIDFAKITNILLKTFFDKNANYLDYAAGYGLFVKLMRDKGLNFYWDDLYTPNLFAKGYEYNKKDRVGLVTCFECFEHFTQPIEEIEKILKISKNILFSTELAPTDPNQIKNWEYLGVNHGQHISFYSEETINWIAKKYDLNYYKLGRLGLLTKKKLNNTRIKVLLFILYYLPKKLQKY